MPAVGFLNVHASLLPRLPGRGPHQLGLDPGGAGDRGDHPVGRSRIGCGAHFSPGAGAHPGGRQFRHPVRRLAERGAALLVQALERLRRGEAVKEPQPQEGVTYAPPISREMRRLHWELPAREVAGWIRGLDPGSRGLCPCGRDEVLKLFGARVKKSARGAAAPGTVLRLSPQGLEIACGQGSVTVAGLQLAGHKRLAARRISAGPTSARAGLGVGTTRWMSRAKS